MNKSKPIKNLISVLSGVAIGLSLAGNVMAYEIGDKMPNWRNMPVYGSGIWSNGRGKNGYWIVLDEKKDNSPDYKVMFNLCDKTAPIPLPPPENLNDVREKPFAVYDVGRNQVLRDKNYDEKIAEVFDAQDSITISGLPPDRVRKRSD